MGERLTRVGRGRVLASLAAPIALTQLAQVAVSTTDIVMMGPLGVEALAAGGLAIVLFNQVRTMGVGLVTASGNQIAAAVGRAEILGRSHIEEVRHLIRASALVATLAGVAGAGVLLAVGAALPWLGQRGVVLELSRAMLVALAPGMVPCLWFQAIRQFTVGMCKPKALLTITLASVALNGGANLVLIHGMFGLPRLGIVGIGVATSLVHLATFGALAELVRRDEDLRPMLSMRISRARWADVLRILRLGVPISLTYGSEAGLFSVLALVMGGFGASALAAHNVVYQLVFITFQVAVGISHGASVLVSRSVAQGDMDRARLTARLALRHSALIVSMSGLTYALAPVWSLRPFLDPADPADVETFGIATGLIVIAVVLQFVDAAQNIAVGLLRGLEDTGAALRLSLAGYWLIGLPIALLLAYPLGLGPRGVWWGLTTGLLATAGLMLRRFQHRLSAVRADRRALLGN